jgi:hypothetical protein
MATIECVVDSGLESGRMKRKRYEIRVEGRLGSSWVDWFDGLAIRDEPDAEGVCRMTVLSGVMDQAALHGTLAKIRDLGIPLLSVRITAWE